MSFATPSRRWKRIATLLLAAGASGCTSASFFAANTVALAGAYERSAGHSFGAEPRLRLDVYSPRAATGRPVVIFFYGGNWTSGERGLYRFVGAALAQRGFVTVIPDYRLHPPAKFPDFLHDGAQAVAWVQQHAARFGGDPQRIVLMGHSAGAHEAAVLAYDRRLLQQAGARPEFIVGLIGLSGPYALEPDTDILNTIFAAPWQPADWQPLRFVNAQSPPTLLIHGTPDDVVSIRHAQRLRDALVAQHVRVETDFHPQVGHSDTVAAFSILARGRAPVLARSAQFIESLTASAEASGAATPAVAVP